MDKPNRRFAIAALLSVAAAVTIFIFIAPWFRRSEPNFKTENLAKTAAVSASAEQAFSVGKNSKGVPYLKIKDREIKSPVVLEIDFGGEKEFDSIVFKEPTNSVEAYSIYAAKDGEAYEKIYESDKMGKYALCYIKPTDAKKLKIEIEKISGAAAVDAIEIYNEGRKSGDFRVVGYLYFNGNNMLE
jgi:hypothetical protein